MPYGEVDFLLEIMNLITISNNVHNQKCSDGGTQQ